LLLPPGEYEIKVEGSTWGTNWYPAPVSRNMVVEAGLEYYLRVIPTTKPASSTANIINDMGILLDNSVLQIRPWPKSGLDMRLMPKDFASKEILETKLIVAKDYPVNLKEMFEDPESQAALNLGVQRTCAPEENASSNCVRKIFEEGSRLQAVSASIPATQANQTQQTGSGPSIGGTYRSVITTSGGSSPISDLGSRSNITVILKKNKDIIIGTFSGSHSGDIAGILEEDTVKFDWFVDSESGSGEWKVTNEGLYLDGTWHSINGHQGNWHLTKIE